MTAQRVPTVSASNPRYRQRNLKPRATDPALPRFAFDLTQEVCEGLH